MPWRKASRQAIPLIPLHPRNTPASCARDILRRMDRQLDPATGDYTGTATLGLENAVWIRLATPQGSWLFDRTLGSRLHELPPKDTERVRSLAEQYAWQALSPLLKDGRATAITVTASRKREGWLDLIIAVTQASGEVATFKHPVKVI